MEDVNWFCDYMGYNLYWYQKLMLKVRCGKEIKRMRVVIDNLPKQREFLTKLPNPDGTVDYVFDNEMLNEIIKPFCK